MRNAFGIGLALAIAAAASARAEDIAAKLVGTYTITEGRSAGKALPKNHLDGSVEITKDRMITYDADHNKVYVIEYTLKGDEAPYKVDMKVVRSSESQTESAHARGLLKCDDDGTVTLIYDYKTGDDYPANFKTDDQTQNKFVLKKMDAE